MKNRYCLWALALTAFLMAAARVHAQQPQQLEIMQAVNQARAAHGLGPVKWDPALAQAAQGHAQIMASQPALAHQYPGEPDLETRTAAQGAHFSVVAENVAMGPSIPALNVEWMHSAPHRQNILDPRMNAIGVGLVERGGNYFGVEDFADSIPTLGPRQIEQKVDALLQQEGIQPSGPERDARQTCEMPSGVAGGSSPKFVMRWEGTDLSHLPPQLVQQIKSGRFHTAAVGACDSAHPEQGFTTYRVAVLLY